MGSKEEIITVKEHAGHSFEEEEKEKEDDESDTIRQQKVIGNGHHDVAAITENTPQLMDFDEFLPHVGEIGRYQYCLFIAMTPFCFFFAFVYFSQMFISLVPEQHWCHIPELDAFNLTDTERKVVL